MQFFSQSSQLKMQKFRFNRKIKNSSERKKVAKPMHNKRMESFGWKNLFEDLIHSFGDVMSVRNEWTTREIQMPCYAIWYIQTYGESKPKNERETDWKCTCVETIIAQRANLTWFHVNLLQMIRMNLFEWSNALCARKRKCVHLVYECLFITRLEKQ